MTTTRVLFRHTLSQPCSERQSADYPNGRRKAACMDIRFLADDSLLNPEDVAALLGVSCAFVYKLMDTGELPVVCGTSS